MNKFRITWWLVKLYFYKWFGRNYVASICKHKAKLFSRVYIFGEEFFFTSKENPEYCPECLAKMSINCAWCGKSIKVHDPITLYVPRSKDFKVPKYAVVHKKDPLQLVGCLRVGCADTGPDREGFWVAPGKVYRVLSLYEIALAS